MKKLHAHFQKISKTCVPYINQNSLVQIIMTMSKNNSKTAYENQYIQNIYVKFQTDGWKPAEEADYTNLPSLH